MRKLAKERGVDLGVRGRDRTDGRITGGTFAQPLAGGAGRYTAARRFHAARFRRWPARPGDAIADNLERQAAIPQVTTFRTVDCTRWKPGAASWALSPLPLVVAALARRWPTSPLNAAWQDGDVEEREAINVGIAVDTEQGLMVPVLRDAGAPGHRRHRRRDQAPRRRRPLGVASRPPR